MMSSRLTLSPAWGNWEARRAAEARAGEVRVNLVRLAVVLGFYLNHLVQYYLVGGDPAIDARYHQAMTGFVVAWGMAIPLVQFLLARGRWPALLPWLVTAWDLILITALLCITPGGGPHSGLLVLYFVVIAAAPLRLSLSLVYLATLGAMAGYLFQLGYYVYFVVGAARYYDASAAAVRIPRTTEIAWLLGLAAAGLLSGQVVRQCRRLGPDSRALEQREQE